MVSAASATNLDAAFTNAGGVFATAGSTTYCTGTDDCIEFVGNLATSPPSNWIHEFLKSGDTNNCC